MLILEWALHPARRAAPRHRADGARSVATRLARCQQALAVLLLALLCGCTDLRVSQHVADPTVRIDSYGSFRFARPALASDERIPPSVRELVRIFQKLAEILQFPLFLPIALVTLLLFLGVVGTIYSHKFLGPLYRIRRAIDQMMAGDLAINLKLRESDEPLLKDLAGSIDLLCEQGRKAHTVIQDAASALFNEIQTLSEKIERGAGASELKGRAENVRKKQELLDRGIRSYRKG